MDRKLAKKIKNLIMDQKKDVEKVRFRKGEIHIYGKIPNSSTVGWWFLGYVQDAEIKGVRGIGLTDE